MFENLKLIDKYSIRVDWLWINTNFLIKMIKSYKDKEVNLKLQSLAISAWEEFRDSDWQEFYLEDKVVEFINKIYTKVLSFEYLNLTSRNIEAFALLNCPNIKAVNSLLDNSYLLFLDTPIQLFDTYMNWKWTFQWESIRIYIEIDKITKIKLFNTEQRRLPIYSN